MCTSSIASVHSDLGAQLFFTFQFEYYFNFLADYESDLHILWLNKPPNVQPEELQPKNEDNSPINCVLSFKCIKLTDELHFISTSIKNFE